MNFYNSGFQQTEKVLIFYILKRKIKTEREFFQIKDFNKQRNFRLFINWTWILKRKTKKEKL